MTGIAFMTRPGWDSQAYPPEGASAAEGIRSQLGRPSLDLLTVLVREAAQNSWDARSDEPGSNVRFGLDLHTVGPAHAHAWRSLLLEGGPRNADNFPLRKSLNATSIRVLAVSDRGTKGLGGPTRADVVTDERRDFITFVRNVGEPRDTELGGGTYGFGKGIFFMLSRPHTVLIHTRAQFEGRLQTRLIGSSLAHSFTESSATGDTRYTGRHWWGRKVDGVVEPLVDNEAEAMIDRLGLQRFAPDESGTTVVVIDPELDDGMSEAEEVGTYLAETIMWQLWPKMLPRYDGRPIMLFDVTVDGQRYEVPDPETTLPINMFVEAYRRMNGPGARAIETKRPRRLLGRLGLNDTWVPPWKLTRAAQTAGFDKDLVHHICLMRAAELVVTYEAGIEPAAELKGYAGVFRADSSLDDTFARAEPPTHDAWNPDSLPFEEKTYVRGVFRRLREIQKELAGLQVSVRSDGQNVALGAASNYFSRLMRGSTGFGGGTALIGGGRGSAGVPALAGAPSDAGGTDAGGSADGGSAAVTSGSSWNGGPGPTGDRPLRRVRIRVEYTGEPFLTRRNEQTVLVQEFRLPPGRDIALQGVLSIAVSMDGSGRETDGADLPRVLGWTRPDKTFEERGTPTVDSDGEGTWQLVIQPVQDTMTVVDVRAEGAA
ncbi:hypothetical protein [Promicromonospora soli]|uniref:Uncharacterized protein n=1 Tax=Promicromonospora soli TaxID=2035533 RepID=A0A919FSP0_9MICO|nr:hypothetical protein [Promicromonospora soli]GHH71044.1 hypothetical protein GCM10017772_18700 [Promicromonospora soli]